MKKFIRISWQVYFCLFTLISIIGNIHVFTAKGTDVYDYIDLILSIISLVVLFCWAWHKKIFTRQVWILFAIVFIFYDVLYNLVLMNKVLSSTSNTAGEIVGLIITLPLYLAIILYAFKWKSLTK
jgi:hypothetical protein